MFHVVLDATLTPPYQYRRGERGALQIAVEVPGQVNLVGDVAAGAHEHVPKVFSVGSVCLAELGHGVTR